MTKCDLCNQFHIYQTSIKMNSKTNKRTRSIFFLLLILSPILAHAQETATKILASGYSLYSSGTELPFWFSSNQQGIFEHANKSYSIGDLSIRKDFTPEKKWDITYGGRAIYAKGASTYKQFNEWFAGISYKSFYFKVGAFPEETIWDGLSSTNGNFDWSNNARPMPRIRLATHDYIPLPFGKKSNFWKDVTFKAIYDEGFLNDDSRYVQNVHLHHKSFFLRKQINKRENVAIGGEHYTMWGGTSPNLGKLPGFKSYLRYVFFMPGSPDGPWSDSYYFAGNQLGHIYLDYQKKYHSGTFTMYINHPFEFLPTILGNLFDNLIGLNFKFHKKGFISNIMAELLNTNDQGGVLHVRNEEENDPNAFFEKYFRHGEYASGFSYENRIIGPPFMMPMVIKDGINFGTGNNRVSVAHVAAKGYLTPKFYWKYMFSYCRSYGTYGDGGQAYDAIIPGHFDMAPHKFSQLLELKYSVPKVGIHISAAVASDNGHWDNNYGCMFKLEKTFTVLH